MESFKSLSFVNRGMLKTPKLSGELRNQEFAHIDFSFLDKLESRSRLSLVTSTVKSSLFSGDLSENISFFRTDMDHCCFDSVTWNNGFLKHSDILDNVYRNSSFTSSNISHCSYFDCIFVNVTFKDVDFVLSAFKKCYFKNVTFIDCNLSRSIIAESQIVDSTFESCKVDSSLFSQCYFSKSKIVNQTIYPDTVMNNLGLEFSSMFGIRLRIENKTYKNNEKIENQFMEFLKNDTSIDCFSKFAVATFINNSWEFIEDDLMDCVKFENIIPEMGNLKSIYKRVDILSCYLSDNFISGTIPLLPVISLYKEIECYIKPNDESLNDFVLERQAALISSVARIHHIIEDYRSAFAEFLYYYKRFLNSKQLSFKILFENDLNRKDINNILLELLEDDSKFKIRDVSHPSSTLTTILSDPMMGIFIFSALTLLSTSPQIRLVVNMFKFREISDDANAINETGQNVMVKYEKEKSSNAMFTIDINISRYFSVLLDIKFKINLMRYLKKFIKLIEVDDE